MLKQHKLSIFQKYLSIDPHLSLMAQVTHHIPVQRRYIEPARLSITAAQSEMYRATYFLVVENVASRLAYAIIHPKGKFPDTSCTFVDVKHTEQVVLT